MGKTITQLLHFAWVVLLLGWNAKAQTLPPGCALDTAYAPFVHGIGSFDPAPDRVLIWTRAEPPAGFSGFWELSWQVATDSAFTNILDQGSAVPQPTHDWTVAVDVEGLQPYTRYYYRFITPNGEDTSRVGRTRTAPANTQAQPCKFAVTSCSSLFSGYFNAYRHIANRADIDLVLHVGDYIYDFVDPDEQVRIPAPFPTVPVTQEEWRARHRLYLTDPDLRLARQNHPFTVAWDNHDFDYNNLTYRDTGAIAFLEYVPMRLEAPTTEPTRIYRRRPYGSLADVLMIDMDSYRNHGAPAAEDTTALGATQLAWLKQNLANSTARWKIVGSQKLFGHWQVPSIPGVSTPIADAGWNEYAAERDSIYAFLQANPVENLVVVSGDAHLTFVLDLPRNPSSGYNATTGAGSLGVEFLPTSISRGNLDEMIGTDFLTGLANNANLAANPHHRYCHFSKHGYGVLSITPDSAVAEVLFLPILSVSNAVETGHRNVVLHGQNHWRRATPVGAVEPANPSANLQQVYVAPNPVGPGQGVDVVFRQRAPRVVTVKVYTMATGQEVPCPSQALAPVEGAGRVRLQAHQLPAGLYLVQVSDGTTTLYTRFLKQ